MQYITVSKAAEKWGVSLRQVQRLLADGRIPDAKKYGRSWMIPADADKPGIGSKNLTSDLENMINAVYMTDTDEKRALPIYEGALGYLVGDFERTIRCYKQINGDDAAKLCATSLTIAAAISTGDYPLYLEVEGFLKSVISANISTEVTTYAELCLATAPIGAVAPSMVPEWLKNGDFTHLYPLTRMEAAYNRAKYFQYLGNYEAMLAVAQTALNFSTPAQDVGIHGIYLRLVCAMACFPLGREDEVKSWLLEAMNLALPHGFITPFAESSAAYGVIMEQLLEQEYPAHIEAIHVGWKCLFPNWVSFHNRFTSDNLTHILSHREHQLAVLAAQDVPYTQIAKHYHMSVGRLNNILQGICEKLYVSSKKDLAKFVVQPLKDWNNT